jgi:two-component system chemotaxis response regulator CheY
MIQSLPKVSILIVAGEDYIRSEIRDVVRSLGVGRVYLARNAKDGLLLAGDNSIAINLIVCDWQLPEMNGIAFIEQARRWLPNMISLMVTGQSDTDHIRLAGQKGINGLVMKPFSRGQLETKLRTLAERIGAPKVERPIPVALAARA